MTKRPAEIKTWDKLWAYISSEIEASGAIYVRWSRSPYLDAKRAYSIDHGRGMVEPGLSVQTIDREDMSHSWSDITVALYLMDYCFAGPVCSLWAGRECGRGADNEICLTDPRLLAIVKTDTPELSERLADLRRRGGRG